MHYYRHGRIGGFVVTEPVILGHESSGTVVARGPAATRHQVGRRVSVEPGTPCGTCTECRPGRYNLCPRMAFFATPPVDGVFCEYAVVHEEFAHAVPDSLGDEAAALLEPLSVGVWSCRKARVAPGDRVLVTGAGPIGLVAAQTALAFGASEVTITDVVTQRLELAEEFGATPVDASRTPLSASGGVRPVPADGGRTGCRHIACVTGGRAGAAAPARRTAGVIPPGRAS
ncbi:Sorbitol dehydrogenase [Streptomyces sp. enrichment culture]|uniref:alcohol dehydrogenase catalytic domain-containing protein n=1 Tax=Streptomyces sp. enrichment culture TaxID=1795815 RepID=UPI003F57839E